MEGEYFQICKREKHSAVRECNLPEHDVTSFMRQQYMELSKILPLSLKAPSSKKYLILSPLVIK